MLFIFVKINVTLELKLANKSSFEWFFFLYTQIIKSQYLYRNGRRCTCMTVNETGLIPIFRIFNIHENLYFVKKKGSFKNTKSYKNIICCINMIMKSIYFYGKNYVKTYKFEKTKCSIQNWRQLHDRQCHNNHNVYHFCRQEVQ